MTIALNAAREIAADIMADLDDDDPLWAKPGRIIEALNVLDEEGTEFDQKIVQKIFDKVPGLLNYDEAGNWIGSVANENGWTA